MAERERSTPTSRRLKSQKEKDLDVMREEGKLDFSWMKEEGKPAPRKRGRKRS